MANGLRGYLNQQTAIPPSVASRLTELEADVLALELGFAALDSEVNGLPIGRMGYAQIVVSGGTSASNTISDVAGLSVSFTAINGRRYRTSVVANWFGSAVSDLLIATITDAANTSIARQTWTVPGNGSWGQVAFSSVETGLSGATTRKVRQQRNTGSGTSEILGGAGFPAYILVEDIGT